jgi:glutamine synthetase
MSFVERHGVWSADQTQAAKGIDEIIRAEKLEIVRFAFPDQHGILRGKSIVASEAPGMLRNGCGATTTLIGKDTSHRTVFPVFTPGGGYELPQMEGGADFLLVADPTTFRLLPWVEKTGWVLCDAYFPDGTAVPFATRRLLRTAVEDLERRGYDYVAGLEVEFHVFKLDDAKMRPAEAGQPGEPPAVSLLSHGYQYLTEQRYDLIEPVLEIIRRDVIKLGLPLRSVEVEFGPSQCEFTFGTTVGVTPADIMVLFRSAAKQICRRHGYHATFMCRPRLPNIFSSGWHLHQSLRRGDNGKNAFMPERGNARLSQTGREFLAGLLTHARAGAVFSTPTINGYKRYRPYSLAPDRINWGHDNRGVMLRVLGGPGDPATRIENRVGEPAANPYLYMTSQIVAGVDGIERGLDPGPATDRPYDSDAQFLPANLREAAEALRTDTFYRSRLGGQFVDYYLRIKDAEIARSQQDVSEWEHREYFEMF